MMMHYGADVTRTKLLKLLSGMDISMSAGSMQNILAENADIWLGEKADLLKAGLHSPFLQTDSTSARVCGKNRWSHIFVSDFFTVFATM